MLGVGNIHKHGENSIQYRVESIEELQVIINHFDKYQLKTIKLVDYLLFKKAFDMIKSQYHLTEKGLLRIIEVKASMNLGLPDNLKQNFPNVIPVNKPEYNLDGILDSY